MKLLECHDRQGWDDYVLENEGHPLQLWGWGDVKAAHGWKAHRLFLNDDESNSVGAVQVLIRRLPWPFRSLAYVPRGPITNSENREELLTQLAKYTKTKHHAVVVTIEPDNEEYTVPKGWIQSVNHILVSKTIILNLTKSEDELLKDMSQKTRRYIRKSTNDNIQIKMVQNREELAKCLAVYHQTSKRAKFDLHDDQYYYDVFDKLGDHSAIFASYIDDQPICFLWLAISANTAYELYGAMNEIGQQSSANYTLKWYALRKCKEWGLDRYDFGGLIGGGINTYKTGWSDKETNLVGTFDYPLSAFYGLWVRGLPMAKKVIRKIKSMV
ncbi:MAG: peptidoglycan bridge formation glycyltransferase FemA/FemB family protein [Candidatus Saccharibacteria bacterium]